MPARNDYLCEICGHYAEYWATSPPLHCGSRMIWAPSRPPAMDHYDVRAFDIDHNGRRYHIDSLETMRKVERETEAAHRNGEGTPLVWRDYSQDRSNVGVHTLTRDLTRPMDGYAEGTTGISRKFKTRVGEAVAADHGL